MKIVKIIRSAMAVAVTVTSSCVLAQNKAVPQPEAVDLGLSVKWASANLGAAQPKDCGFFFAWGEQEPKETFTQDNSLTYKVSLTELKAKGIADKTTGYLAPAHDPARSMLGGKWRVPTAKEVDELIRKCTWKWVDLNGFCGYEITGVNGNVIYLPAVGCKTSDIHHYNGEKGLYWTATPNKNSSYSAYELTFGKGLDNKRNCNWNERADRYSGQQIRPVTD